ncbi:MAG: hypothetical protein WCJ81_04970 [bacterium]
MPKIRLHNICDALFTVTTIDAIQYPYERLEINHDDQSNNAKIVMVL